MHSMKYKSPLKAVFFNQLLMGMGFLYIGRIKYGLLFLFIKIAVFTSLILYLSLPIKTNFIFFIPIVFLFLFEIYAIVKVYKETKKYNRYNKLTGHSSPFKKFYINCKHNILVTYHQSIPDC